MKVRFNSKQCNNLLIERNWLNWMEDEKWKENIKLTMPEFRNIQKIYSNEKYGKILNNDHKSIKEKVLEKSYTFILSSKYISKDRN
jgi:hypothetical protein